MCFSWLYTLQTVAKMTWSIYPAKAYHFDQIISFRYVGSKKRGGVPCSTNLLKESQKNIWMSHLETSCSSDLQFLNIVPLLCPAYTFSKVFIREDWTAPQTDSWGRKSWGALAIMIYLEDLQQLQKVLQAILKHRKRTLLEGYAGISETTILFYIC